MAKDQTVESFFSVVDHDVLKVICEHANPSNKFGGKELKDIVEWKFCDVFELSGMDSYTAMLFILNRYLGFTEIEVLKGSAPEMVSIMKHVAIEFQKITGLMEMLKTEPSTDMINAGIENLDKFGLLNIYYSINKNPLEWDSISEVSFDKMFTKLLMDKEHAGIQQRFNQIQENKPQNKHGHR